MSGSGEDWCTIESDPGVFTELLEEVGVKGVQLEEIWTLDALPEVPIYGFIFLFKWKPGQDTAIAGRTPLTEVPDGLFFAHQVTTNACATQALLSVVLNQGKDDENKSSLELGPTLSEFQTFTASFPPELKGEAIGASQEIKTAHNSFSRKDSFLSDGKQYQLKGDEDVFHFVAYIPHTDGHVYELDGLQKGPIDIGVIGDAGGGDWTTLAKAAIQQRMEATTDVKFNLMAVIQDKQIGLQDKLKDDSTTNKEEIQAQLVVEEEQRLQWTRENQRRKHNYVGLCVAMLKEMAKQGTLPKHVEKAQQERMQKRQKKAG